MKEAITIVLDNFTPILGALTVISFVINVVQYKTKRMSAHIFSSIYHTANRAFKENKVNEKMNQEYNSIIIAIRHQAVSGLRSSDVNWYYEDEGMAGGNGFIYSLLASVFRLLVAIRVKFPQLIKGNFPKPKD